MDTTQEKDVLNQSSTWQRNLGLESSIEALIVAQQLTNSTLPVVLLSAQPFSCFSIITLSCILGCFFILLIEIPYISNTVLLAFPVL